MPTAAAGSCVPCITAWEFNSTAPILLPRQVLCGARCCEQFFKNKNSGAVEVRRVDCCRVRRVNQFDV